jgi:LPS-assembly protein
MILWIACWTCIPRAGADEAQGPTITLDPAQPYRIWADKITYDPERNAYLAEGNVTIRKEDYSLKAQWIRFDTQSATALAKGEVVLTSGEDRLSGERVEVNLEEETGTLYSGTLFLAENHFYIRGEEIRKTGPATYRAKNATITTCDGPSPDWALSGRRIAVTIEGYGSATHAAMRVKGVPLLYSPYMFFPVKLKRQSGLLAPQVGISDRKGWRYSQPLFLVLGESSDATLYADYMEKRGLRGGLELRYILDEASQGTLMADGFSDRRLDDGQEDNSRNWGYDDTSSSGASDDIPRLAEDRYWLRMKHDQALPAGFNAQLDLDLVSDQDYLHEFKSGYMGFEETRDYFLDTFGRDIDDYDDNLRPNRLNFARTWGSYSLNLEGRWNDNVLARQEYTDDDMRDKYTDDETLQRLPALTLDVSRHRVLESPLYFTAANEAVHLYEPDGDKGYRLDLYPRLLWPFKLGHYLSLEPSAGYRQTLWNRYENEADPDQEGSADHRELYDLRLDLSSEVYRIFPGLLPAADRTKHSLRPQLTYTYIPRVDQDDLPKFNSVDRIERRNQLTWTLTQTLTGRWSTAPVTAVGKANAAAIAGAAAGAADATPKYRYQQVARLELDQDYDLNAANDGDPEPWSDLRLEFDLTPDPRFSVNSEARWSVYEEVFTRYSIGATLRDRRGDSLTAEYRKVLEDTADKVTPSESLNAHTHLVLHPALALRGSLDWDLYAEEVREWLVGFTFTRQCWSFDLNHSVEDEDRRTYFMINLVGLGRFGG